MLSGQGGAVHQLVVGDGHRLGVLVLELGLRRARLREPVLGGALVVEHRPPWTPARSSTFPASVGPRSTFLVPRSSVRSVGWMRVLPPTAFDTPSSVIVMPLLPASPRHMPGESVRSGPGAPGPLPAHECIERRGLLRGQPKPERGAPATRRNSDNALSETVGLRIFRESRPARLTGVSMRLTCDKVSISTLPGAYRTDRISRSRTVLSLQAACAACPGQRSVVVRRCGIVVPRERSRVHGGALDFGDAGFREPGATRAARCVFGDRSPGCRERLRRLRGSPRHPWRSSHPAPKSLQAWSAAVDERRS